MLMVLFLASSVFQSTYGEQHLAEISQSPTKQSVTTETDKGQAQKLLDKMAADKEALNSLRDEITKLSVDL